MKKSKSKYLTLAGLVLGTGVLLSACGNSSTASKTYNYVYSSDPSSLNYLAENRATTNDIVTNLVDGLMENDQYGNYVPSLAEDWTVSQDGLTYTYKLRKDAKWFTSEGEEYAPVTAQDFVTGLQYAADKKSEALYLVQDSVAGLDDYITGKTSDFSTVGIKALDDQTVQYTLARPEPYWNSKTTSTILFPVNADFLKSKGDDFGKVDPANILYSGPFLMKAFVSKSVIEYKKNPNYWDAKNVFVDDVKLTYYDGSDQDALVRNFTDGAYSYARLYPNSSSFEGIKEKYKDDIIYSMQDATSYYWNFNLDRQAYKFTSKTTDIEKKSTQEAVLNKNFRQAINFAFDRTSYGAQSEGKEGATKILRNLVVPPNFVSIKGKDFGEVVASKMVNYGKEWQGINFADGQDPYYNPEKAKAKFAEAKKELEAKGVQFPIHLDKTVEVTDKVGIQGVSSIKQSIESVLGSDNVVIDIQQLTSDEFDSSGYFAQTAAQKDYDLYHGGWGPDYQDPSTYLDILSVKSGGMLQNFGLEPGEVNEKAKAVGLDTYTQMLEEANKEQDPAKRYEKYADIQAWLIDSSLVLPSVSRGGTPSLRRTVPFAGAYGLTGTKGVESYKYLKVQDKIVTTDEYAKAREKWLKEKEESNKKAQEELAKHVK
ncbi:TPA: peptide ABC transporter substrate-binding protein [Streptococcus pneumoniae]|uniref:peptide ABC transporter substrate-binding protein n=1 Tax=Streptococcus pneumoniae TaxID=1313 RepID=UPI0001E35B46|nr:peptide ABC transporter substrate-binding protein [Streptococcus pneumoniae]EHD86783.1 oligopeptide-binding protein sarA [Streptococcus pneumoniae GA11304]ADM91666.1 oligopeptide binding lipoprotein [Streptococcus pneumoniae 670-6B]KWX83893.1 peptide ABC transporter ATP-binding protein [Streptococcus pneumoniae]KXB96000.1 peptide ABC transporter ATP-binding protein [Streptococcus pneumoniae]MDG8103544.1 peptide ABC transporter substrate-binding protein [Streptococcus pneumoniae]